MLPPAGLHEPLPVLAARWRELSRRWQREHAPTSSYERLCRASELEIDDGERANIRKDIRRSRPDFFKTYAPDLDEAAHFAKLERVLCSWAVYDAEIGYVQAMNLVASTLLLLLDGDEECAFWVLVTLLRQLPPQFYSRAPLQLVGFWVEVEVLVQLADRLLGLHGLRGALLQIAPRWFLEFWVGTLPLGGLVLVWDQLLRCASTQGTPSTLNLQVALALLQLQQARVAGLLSERGEDVQEAYLRLSDTQLPDSDGSWLLQSALEVQLNNVTVQEMRLQLRMALLHRCRQSALLPCMRPLPRVCTRMPILLRVPNKRARPLRPLRRMLPRRCAARVCRPGAVAPAAACVLLLAVFATSCVLSANCLAPTPPPPPSSPPELAGSNSSGSAPLAPEDGVGPLVRSWALARIDGSLLLLLLLMGTAVATCVHSWRRAAACCAACCAVYALGKGFAVLALGDALYRYAGAGEGTDCADCCTWVYCPCIKWWWLVVQGSVMGVAAALQLAALFQRRRSTSIALSELASEFVVGEQTAWRGLSDG